MGGVLACGRYNLAEMHQPLLGFLRKPGADRAVTAKTFFDSVAGVLYTEFGAITNQVGDFGTEMHHGRTGIWVEPDRTHLWEHYSFNKDDEYLRDYAYPLMKEQLSFV